MQEAAVHHLTSHETICSEGELVKFPHQLKPSPAVWNAAAEKGRNGTDTQKQQMWLEGVIKKKSLKNISHTEQTCLHNQVTAKTPFPCPDDSSL